MTALAGNALDAIEHLPAGSTLVVPDVSWAAYERLLSDLGEGYAVRIHYDRGRLSIMSPSARHEKCKELILRIADTIADELGCDLESFGSTTFKTRELGKGAEPDTCFYVQSAAAVAGKVGLDPAVDPPPDVIVEIDLAHTSEGKFSFYAGLRAPELWLYDGDRAQIYHLTAQGYEVASVSRAFPILTSLALTRFMAEGQAGPERAVLKSLRQWIRAERQARGE
jgi:Uma2 family endonuclease